MGDASNTTKPHVAALASPGMGHLIPLLEFAKHLVTNHGVHVSFLVVTTQSSAAQRRHLDSTALPNDLHVVNLPQADVSSVITPDMPLLTRLSLLCRESVKPLGSIFEQISFPRALIIDNFMSDALDICEELKVPVYTFYTSPPKVLALGLYLPKLDKEVECEFVDLPNGSIQVPGCRPLCVDDLQDSLRNRKVETYKWNLHHASRLTMATGIFVNSWDDLESKSCWFNGLKSDPYYQSLPVPRIYPVGPLIKHDEPVSRSDAYILSWLDNEPCDSVLFVALGSGGTLTKEQLTELAIGLEMSKQKFILVARKPSDMDAAGTYFNAGSNVDDPKTYLPEGFLERTAGVGLVVPSWAPQVPVLRHKATGGFLSHCGWNSSLESIVHGVPMIAWPLFAEQRMNATLLTEEVAVAVKPVGELQDGRKVVRREEVERVVRLVLQGEEGKVMRNRMRELKDSAAKALEQGGSSYDSVSCVVKTWKQA
ncbi:UDP-glycosyltransferase 72B1-like [Apium graveolens]|uniref:UDP-glycosyltransferase 72B1-like n=1 Tax=Apium graveolens TaxID=4045 RepID=UPI003D7A10CC